MLAAEGTLRIQLPSELQNQEIHYLLNGEAESACADEEGMLTISGLDADQYLVQLQDADQYLFGEMEVPVPMWDMEAEKMSYDISVEPKYVKVTPVPNTGDHAPVRAFALAGGVACVGAMTVLLWGKRRRK